jgi:hypothetical protein
MLGLITGFLSDATAPLVHSATDFAARLARKLVLFLVAGLCLVVVLIALTIAFDLWIASLAGPIVGALAVAGLYLVVAVVAVVLALRDAPGRPATAAKPAEAAQAHAQGAADARPDHPETDERIDQFTAPILDMLQRFGLHREQLAVFAGASVAKRLGPLSLVGCALLMGFLVGRMWKSWRHVLDSLLAASPLISQFLNTAQAAPEPPTPSQGHAG